MQHRGARPDPEVGSGAGGSLARSVRTAARMTSAETRRVNGVDLAVSARGEGPLVVLAHGFPDLSITWRHQVPALVAAGFRVIAVDMRGYGRSSRPTARRAYALREVVLDLVGLLEHEGADTAHFVGHDW